jgi:hypothetical protein
MIELKEMYVGKWRREPRHFHRASSFYLTIIISACCRRAKKTARSEGRRYRFECYREGTMTCCSATVIGDSSIEALVTAHT